MAGDDSGLTGDWSGALKRIGAMPSRIRSQVQLATRQNALGLEREIKEGMIAQAPGGVPYAPLHPLTIALRYAAMSTRARAKAQGKGAAITAAGGVADKALINHGDLLGSVTHAIAADGLSAAVGVNRKAKTRDGKDVVDIARIVFYGAVIPVTARMRWFFRSQGYPLKASTTQIIIPPRRTIEPAYVAYRPEIVARFQLAAIRGVTGK